MLPSQFFIISTACFAVAIVFALFALKNIVSAASARSRERRVFIDELTPINAAYEFVDIQPITVSMTATDDTYAKLDIDDFKRKRIDRDEQNIRIKMAEAKSNAEVFQQYLDEGSEIPCPFATKKKPWYKDRVIRRSVLSPQTEMSMIFKFQTEKENGKVVARSTDKMTQARIEEILAEIHGKKKSKVEHSQEEKDIDADANVIDSVEEEQNEAVIEGLVDDDE